jgi:hypothetical protein
MSTHQTPNQTHGDVDVENRRIRSCGRCNYAQVTRHLPSNVIPSGGTITTSTGRPPLLPRALPPPDSGRAIGPSGSSLTRFCAFRPCCRCLCCGVWCMVCWMVFSIGTMLEGPSGERAIRRFGLPPAIAIVAHGEVQSNMTLTQRQHPPSWHCRVRGVAASSRYTQVSLS